MITKGRRGAAGRNADPLDIRLTVTFRFGDEREDRVVVMNDRSIPLVGTVFESRDRIVRGFSRLLFKAAAQRPRVAAELLPLFGLLSGRGRGKKKSQRKSKK